MTVQSFTSVLFLLQIAALKGANLTNSSSVTETKPTLNHQNITLNGSTATETTVGAMPNTTWSPTVVNESGATVNLSKTTETIHEVLDTTSNDQDVSESSTIIVNCYNESCDDQMTNETLKTNYSMVAEAIGASSQASSFGLQETTAVAAGVFLISAILGYMSCVGYRRYLQRKYGNSQVLVTEDVYDTTDLRYFEI